MTDSSETIKKVAEEGLEARNLVNFMADGIIDDNKVSSKPPLSPVSPKAAGAKDPDTQLMNKEKRRSNLSRPKSRLRSSSAGRNPEKDLRTRYWTFLFENLHRAVDEIYQTCEMDESIVESKEAIMMLENYSKDFHSLIQYITINKNYEKTAHINRPTSLAWEVRKSSPGKSLLKNVFIERLTAGNFKAKKILCLDKPNETLPVESRDPIPPAISETKESSCEREIIHSCPNTCLNVRDSAIHVPVVQEIPANLPGSQGLVVSEVVCSPAGSAEKTTGNVSESGSNQACHGSNVALPKSSASETLSAMIDAESVAESKSFDACHSGRNISDPVDQIAFGAKNLFDQQVSAVSHSEPLENVSSKKGDNEIKADRVAKPAESSSNQNSDKNLSETGNCVKRKALVKKMSVKPNDQNQDRPSSSKEDKHVLKSSQSGGSIVSSVENKMPKKENTASKTNSATCDSRVLRKRAVRSNHSIESSSLSRSPVSKLNSEKVCTATVVKPVSKPPIKKTPADVKKMQNVSAESKKPVQNGTKYSAIQRNISYVSSLSSKNQQEKAALEEKKKPIRTISHAVRLPPHKSGSMSCLHKISTSRKWGMKASSVEQIPESIKNSAEEDSDGWEMVRGRNRCRNSPAKKTPSERNNQVLDLAKLSQARFGGFPYTTKNAKITPTKKESKHTNENPVKIENNAIAIPHSEDFNSVNLSSALSNLCQENFQKGFSKDNGVVEIKLKYSDSSVKSSFSARSLSISDEICAKIVQKSFSSNSLQKSHSFPNLTKGTFWGKNKNLSEQWLLTKKSKKSWLSRSYFEKNSSSNQKKSRKLAASDVQMTESNSGSGESDAGVTSDEQEGQTSLDEAFDAQYQDLCNTALKYKIVEQEVHQLELSWGEQMDRFDMELRTPGRALEMHEKLSSPFRKKSLVDSIRLQEEKQVKARERRERLCEEKLQKIKEIEKKRQEMKALVEQRQEKQRVLMEQKLQRAEEKRKKQLEKIIRKAHDEEEKVNEIAFINSLEAQNKRHDLISKERDHEARLHDIQEERHRKQEEKAAKEAAAEERRKLLEAERQARLNEMQAKRKIRDHKVEQLLLVKEKERQELANQKARDREQRLSALNAQQQTSIEELQKKIQLKQEESARRHEENIEQIRQKAFELSVRRCSSNNDEAPQPVPYETKKICTLCNVLIGSEVYLLSHLRGKKHQETVKDQYQGQDLSIEEMELYNLKHIVDASTDQLDPNIAFDKERQKALKKRCKKLRQRMSNKGQEFESKLEEKIADNINSSVKSKVSKILEDLRKLNEKSSDSSQCLISLDRCLKDLESVFEKLSSNKTTFRAVGGLGAVVEGLKIVSSLKIEKSVFLHKRIISNLNVIAETCVESCQENCLFLLYSNRIGCLLDQLILRLNIVIPNYGQIIVQNSKSSGLNLPVDLTAGKLMSFLSKILTNLAGKSAQNNHNNVCDKENQSSEFQSRVQDVISYAVSIGIVDKLSQYFNSIQGPINNEEEVATYILHCISFLSSVIKLYYNCFVLPTPSKAEDSTQLIAAIKVTSMMSTVSLLYSLLLHSGATSRGDTPPPQLTGQIESLVYSTLCMINNIAVMNLQAFQTILGSEDLSLQLRYITSHLLWYCNHWMSETVLHEVILLVGYFTVLNNENQSVIQAGQRPTVLQQLCSLPFLYFSDTELTDILFPTLIACCFKNPNNRTVLEQEMSSELLSNYIEVQYLSSEEGFCNSRNVEKRWQFATRFPKSCWISSKQYFASK